MAVPVGTTAMWVRAIGEPWHRVGLRLTPGRNWGPKEGLLKSEKTKQGVPEEVGGLGFLEASCLEVSKSQGPKESL